MMQVSLTETGELMHVQQAAKSAASFRQAASFQQIQRQVTGAGEENETDWFRSTIHQSLAHITIDPSVRRTAVDVSPEAMQAMKRDPAYRRQVIALVNRDLGHSYAPREVNMYIRVGATLSEYSAQTRAAEQDEEFEALSAGSFFTSVQPETEAEEPRLSPQAEAAHLFREHMNAQLAAHSYRVQPRAAAYQARAYGMF